MPLHHASSTHHEPSRIGWSNCVHTLFSCSGSVFPHVFPIACFYALVGGVATLLWARYPGQEAYEDVIAPNGDMHHYFNLLVGLLLVFRTTTSYERYDAGVESSGTLKSTTRNLVSQVVALTASVEGGGELKPAISISGDSSQPPAERFIRNCQRLMLLYCMMFARHIHKHSDKPLDALVHRGLVRQEELGALAEAPPCCRTLLVMQWLRNAMAEATRAGLLDSSALRLIDPSVTALVHNYQSAIRVVYVGTPLPWRQAVKLVIR
jgi:putative membrane protein